MRSLIGLEAAVGWQSLPSWLVDKHLQGDLQSAFDDESIILSDWAI